MIRTVVIQNFKNIRDETITLERFTIFVGANGSGKTSVLQAIYLATRWNNNVGINDESLTPYWIYTRNGENDLCVRCETNTGYYEVRFDQKNYLPKYDRRSGNDIRMQIASSATPMIYLRLNSARLAEPSYSDESTPQIKEDGSGAASVLAHMALNDPDAFNDLSTHLRELLPRIKRIRFRKTPVDRSEAESFTIGTDSGTRQVKRTFQGEAILFDYDNAPNVAAHTASEGTLLILGLLTVLLSPDRPKVLLLDDIEHGLHPLVQKQLVAMIGRIMAKFPELQIIATAHSPYLLNYLAPEQVRIMAVDAAGHARCGRLTDHPKFATWKDEMAPGEMWSLFGERWLAGAEATS